MLQATEAASTLYKADADYQAALALAFPALIKGDHQANENSLVCSAQIQSQAAFMLLLAVIIGSMPEAGLQFLAILAHTLYQGVAYAIEHVLIQHFGTSTFQVQMLVCHLSVAARSV